MDDDYDDDYDLEYSDDSGSEPDINLENQYYMAKGIKNEGDLRGALDAFQAVLDIETEKGDWGFKALKQMVKVCFLLEESEKMITYYGRLLSYVKVVTKNYAEKSINSILDFVSNLKQMSLLHKFYAVTLDCLKESHNERLWFKTNTKLAKLYLDEKDFSNFDLVLSQLKSSCQTDEGDLDDKKGTQMLEIYALEIQKYTEQKNNKALQQLYTKALRVKSAIPHPLIMGTIRECGGKMHLRNGVYDQAHTDFFEAFKSYDESGSPRRIQCLKYLVLAAMLMKTDINPFDSQETKAFKNDAEIVTMNRLIMAYQNDDLKEFQKLLDENQHILADDFVKEHITELIDNIRIEVVRKTIRPYTSVSLDYLAKEIQVNVDEVTRLLTQIILDKDSEYRIDQSSNTLFRSSTQKSEIEGERERAIDKVLDQLELMQNNLIYSVY
uniref:PCI domain-containing protein n=1 Tax=Panagrolaimus sp. JU765 TaxID=591449 RepID=A0AC34Q405_9BILA